MKLSSVRVTLMERSTVLECLNMTLNVFIHIYEFNYEGKVTQGGRCAVKVELPAVSHLERAEKPVDSGRTWAGREQSPAGHHLRLRMLRWRRSL